VRKSIPNLIEPFLRKGGPTHCAIKNIIFAKLRAAPSAALARKSFTKLMGMDRYRFRNAAQIL
jgi:hypothetical protein